LEDSLAAIFRQLCKRDSLPQMLAELAIGVLANSLRVKRRTAHADARVKIAPGLSDVVAIVSIIRSVHEHDRVTVATTAAVNTPEWVALIQFRCLVVMS